MSAVNMMILIIPRELSEGYSLFLRDAGLKSTFSCLCEGTASFGALRRLGLEKNEKMLKAPVFAHSPRYLIRNDARNGDYEIKEKKKQAIGIDYFASAPKPVAIAEEQIYEYKRIERLINALVSKSGV